MEKDTLLPNKYFRTCKICFCTEGSRYPFRAKVCRKCSSLEYNKRYKDTTPKDILNKKSRQYYQNNKEKRQIKSREYYHKNRERMRAGNIEYKKTAEHKYRVGKKLQKVAIDPGQ